MADYEAYLPVFRTRIVNSAILSAAYSDDFRYFVAVTRIEQVSHGSEPRALTFVLNGNIYASICEGSLKFPEFFFFVVGREP